MIDGNDIWEALFSILKGDVPDALTEDVLSQLADYINTAAMDTRKPGSAQ